MLPEYLYFLGKLRLSLPLLWENLQPPGFDPWLLLRWTLQALLITALILLADYAAGAGLLSALRLRLPGRLRLLAALSTGLAIQGLFCFLLGLTGHLTRRSLALGLAALALAGCASLWRSRQTRHYLSLAWLPLWPRRWWPILLASPLLLLLLADLMQPVAESDSAMYHMAAARWYRHHHALPYHSGIRFNAQPHLSVLLYLRHWLLTGDDTLLKLFNLELLLLLAAALRAALRDLRLPSALLPLLILSSSPVFVWIMKIEYADAALCAFLTSGGVLLLAALRRRSVPLALIAGVSLAAAGAIKLQGLVTAALLLFAFAASAISARWPPRSLALALTGAAASLALWGSGWWFRSWLATGSPAYPFFSSTPDLARLMEVNQTYGFGHGLSAFLWLPIHAITQLPARFADNYVFGPALLLVLLSAAALALRRTLSRPLLTLALALALCFAFWFFTGQVMRYWATTLGLQTLWICAGLGPLLNRHALRWTLTAPLALCSVLNLIITSPTLRQGWPPPVTLSQKETVQAETLPYYRAVRTLNQLAAPTEPIYALCAEEVHFHFTRPSAGDWFGPHSYFWLGQASGGEAGIVRRLRQAGFRYILFDRHRGAERATVFAADFAQSQFLRLRGTPPGTRSVYDDGRYAAYEVLPE